MIRRKFISDLSLSIGGLATTPYLSFHKSKYEDLILGHGSHQYKIDLDWGKLDVAQHPVNDCHEMVQDSKGRIILLTNHTQNNIIIYNKDGVLQEVWGTEFPGAHGLTLHNEGGKDILYISDNIRNEIIKTSIDGKVLKTFPCPLDSGHYKKKEEYVPTETAISKNGDVFVADGYGLQYILHYNAKGELQNVFGGKGENDENFSNAHGICVDNRTKDETLLITDRMQNCLKRFTMEGKFIEKIELPGAFICRPVIHNNHIYLATIWSGDGQANTGFVSILDQNNKLISAPGGCKPSYINGRLEKMYQTHRVFQHPHDVCIDEDESLYVAQWNAGRSYPIKMIRV